MNLSPLIRLTRSTVVGVLLAWLVAFLPGLRSIQAAEAAGAPPRAVQAGPAAQPIDLGSCGGASRIIQGCVFSNGSPDSAWYALEQQAIADLLTVHQLPGTDKSRLLGWERTSVRALMFNKLVAIIQKDPAQRTASERTIYDQLAAFVRSKRLAAATFSKAQYNKWAANPCEYVPPAGFKYAIPSTCAGPGGGLGGLLGGPQPPSLEEFQNYGAAWVASRFQDAATQAVAAYTARALGFVGGIGVAVGAATAAGIIGANLGAGSALIAAIHPFLAATIAGTNAGGAAAAAGGTAAGVVGAVSLAAVAAIVVVAIVIGVMQGINVFTAAAIPGKLDDAVTAAQATPDLTQLITTDAGVRELYAEVLLATLPDFPAASGIPAQQATDRAFDIDPGPSAQASATVTYKAWDDASHTVYLSDGWFVDDAAGTKQLTLDIDYLDWDGKGWTAWRVGDRFLNTRTGDGAQPFLSDTIKYKDAAGTNRTAKLGPAAAATAPVNLPVNVGPRITFTPVATPAFAGAPPDVTVDQTRGDGAVVSFPTPVATANGEAVAVTCAPASGATFPVGATVVTCTAAGAVTVTTRFTVTVRATFGWRPTLAGLSPDSGPAGTAVTITGSGFIPGEGASGASPTRVNFGGYPSPYVRCASTTVCIATSPFGRGAVYVEVLTDFGTSDPLTFTHQNDAMFGGAGTD